MSTPRSHSNRSANRVNTVADRHPTSCWFRIVCGKTKSVRKSAYSIYVLADTEAQKGKGKEGRATQKITHIYMLVQRLLEHELVPSHKGG